MKTTIKTNRLFTLLLCALFALAATGCASFAARNEKPTKRTVYYPGVSRDLVTINRINAESKKPAAPAPKDDEDKKPASPKYALVWLAVPFIDLPFSLVWDTLALPVDYWNRDAIQVRIGAEAYK